jgi:lysozyme
MDNKEQQHTLHRTLSKQEIIDFIFLSLLLIFVLWWAVVQYLSSPPYVDTTRYPIRGIDISAHNGMMNLDAAAADGIKFVFIKASEGDKFRDTNFSLNYDKARKAGLKIGVYHFFRFDVEGVPQAMNLLKTIDKRELDLGLVIDVEKQGNPTDVPIEKITDRLSAMLDYLNLKGYRAILYTNRDGYYQYISDNFRGYPLWICSFSRYPIDEDWTFWQYNHHGKVKGITGDVDLNTFYGDQKDWYDYLATYKQQ